MSKPHEIRNQHGKHILDNVLLKEIKYILEKGYDKGIVDGREVSIHSDKRNFKERITIVHVHGLGE